MKKEALDSISSIRTAIRSRSALTCRPTLTTSGGGVKDSPKTKENNCEASAVDDSRRHHSGHLCGHGSATVGPDGEDSKLTSGADFPGRSCLAEDPSELGIGTGFSSCCRQAR